MIQLLIINSLMCLGVFNSVNEGMLLSFIKKGGDKFLPTWLRKPIYDCPPCMASLWSWPYIIFNFELTFYPGYIFALSGMNILLNSIIYSLDKDN